MSTSALASPAAITAASLDPRAQRSRDLLIAAMIEHLDRTLTPPGISELVKAAGSSRPTFYQHFGDIPTLMHEAAMRRLESAFAAFPAPSVEHTGPWTDFATAHFPTLFAHLVEHRDFYLAIVDGPSGVAALNRLIEFLAARMHLSAPLHAAIVNRVGAAEAPRFAQFLASGLTLIAVDDLRAHTDVPHMVATTTAYLAAATDSR